MAEYGTYLYAITYDLGESALPRLTGVAGTDVRALERSGLRAFVGEVPLEEFGEEALRQNLEDLAWLESTARAHNDVVDSLARATPTAPVRLVTVYSGDEQVAALLDQREEEFRAVLSRIAGRSEWGVKVYVDQERAAQSAPANAVRERPGMAYLKRRRHDLQSREEAWQQAASRAAAIDDALAALSVATRKHPAQDPQLSGRKEWMVLNAAYLVDDERRDEFTRAANSIHDPDIEIQLTGPWAPYSFATLESIPSSQGANHDA